MKLIAPFIFTASLGVVGCQQTSTVQVVSGGSQANINRTITVPSNGSARLGFFTALHPDCSPVHPAPVVRVSLPPQHGVVDITQAHDFAFFPPANTRSRCNTTRVPGLLVTYRPTRGYSGMDAFAFENFTARRCFMWVRAATASWIFYFPTGPRIF